MRLLLFTFLLSALSFGQDRNGISYQALIINPNVEQLPGQDNHHAPLTNTDICLQFHIINSSGNYEYSESQSVTTDAYGMVNLVIGTGTPIGAITWDAVAWSAEAKSLKVDLDITGACTSFTELSNQQLTSVPFALYSPASDVPGPKGDPGDPGEDGDSAYQVWLDEGNTGTEQDFLDSLKGTDGTPGDPGADGDSAYQVWLDAGNTGTEQEFLDSLKGADGTPGDPGADGDSAYQVWLDAGNTGTEQEFLDSLKGADGSPGEGTEGKSAYDVWIELGNTGSEQDFIDSLVGPQGEPGQDGAGSSINGLANAVKSVETRINLFKSFNTFRNNNHWATTQSYSSNFYTTTSGNEINIYDYDLNKIGESINVDNIVFPTGYNKFDIKYFGGVYAIDLNGDIVVCGLTTNDDKRYFVYANNSANEWVVDKLIELPQETLSSFRFSDDLSKFIAIYSSTLEKSIRSYNVDINQGTLNLNGLYNLPVTNSYSFFTNDNVTKLIVSGFNNSSLNIQVLNISSMYSFTKLFDFEIPHNFIPYASDSPSIRSLSMNSNGSLMAVIIGVRTENYPQTIREYKAIIYSVGQETLVKKQEMDLPNFSGSNSPYMSAPQMILNESGDKIFFSDASGYQAGGFWNVYNISSSEFIPIGGGNYDYSMNYYNAGGAYINRIYNWRNNLVFGGYGSVLYIKKIE